MKKQYFDNCAKERNQFLALLNDLFKRMEVYDGMPIQLLTQTTPADVTE